MPSTRCRVCGLAAAHSPNAPSTCTHAPAARAASQIVRKSSHAPVFTLPACAHTIVGTSLVSSASDAAAHRPASPRCRRPAPRRPTPLPTRRTAARGRRVPCRSDAGERHELGALRSDRRARRPIRALRRTCCRAASSPTVLAACPPVTNPTVACSGMPSRSFSHTPAASSATAAAGDDTALKPDLVPPGGEQIRAHGCIDGAADHEAEEPRSGGRHEPGRRGASATRPRRRRRRPGRRAAAG